MPLLMVIARGGDVNVAGWGGERPEDGYLGSGSGRPPFVSVVCPRPEGRRSPTLMSRQRLGQGC